MSESIATLEGIIIVLGSVGVNFGDGPGFTSTFHLQSKLALNSLSALAYLRCFHLCSRSMLPSPPKPPEGFNSVRSLRALVVVLRCTR
jgi:hypothetical protein